MSIIKEVSVIICCAPLLLYFMVLGLARVVVAPIVAIMGVLDLAVVGNLVLV